MTRFVDKAFPEFTGKETWEIPQDVYATHEAVRISIEAQEAGLLSYVLSIRSLQTDYPEF